MELISKIEALGNPAKVKTFKNFFKTGPRDYGEGEVFLGISMPRLRELRVEETDQTLALSHEEIITVFLNSIYHDVKMFGVLVMVAQYQAVSAFDKQLEQVEKYLATGHLLNNWDFVDCSASYILGHFLYTSPDQLDGLKVEEILKKLIDGDVEVVLNEFRKIRGADQAQKVQFLDPTNNSTTKLEIQRMWMIRIAIVSTFYFIKNNQLTEILSVSDVVLKHSADGNNLTTHDLISKSLGWMLREAWKKNKKTIAAYLTVNAHKMSKTTVRYASEKMTPSERRKLINLCT